MKKFITKLLIIVSLLTLVLYVAAHIFVPGIIDKKYNRVFSNPPYNVASLEATKLHEELLIADLHSDALIWGRDLLENNDRGHVDIPRLSEGNIALQVFSVPTKVPKKISQWGTDPDQLNLITLSAITMAWPISSWFNLSSRVTHLGNYLNEVAEESGGRFRVIKTSSELNELFKVRERKKELTGGILAIEGLHALDGEIENLDQFYVTGYRIMGLVHHFDNMIGGSSYGLKKGGLTKFGRRVIEKMDELGIIIDLAHASEQLIEDVLEVTSRPVVVSHTGVKGTCKRTRNLGDDQVRAIAEKGGLIAIGFWRGAVCGTQPTDIARAIRYTVELVGIEHVALGSDFDGDAMPFDATGMVQITEALLNEGFSETEIKKIMGENLIGFLLENLPEN
ncbi:MAG: dipeptidase [candidate division Zixibacteria bacterium]|nr:dipeptidase [candidate division Zixibacteria bacterium]